MSSQVEGVPFAFFCSLLREISNIKPRSTAYRQSHPRNETRDSYPALDIFNRWLKALREKFSPLPPGTTAICFRLLFPEEDNKRKYEIQEKRLTGYLSDILGASRKDLDKWDSEDASGCLGTEVMRLLRPKFANRDEMTSHFSIAQVDELLSELAATSSYSDSSIRSKYPPPHRKRGDILKSLFRHLPPLEAGFMTHIILKDLQPILYPSPEVTCSVSLLDYNTNAVKMLQVQHVIMAWDPSRYMQRLYRVKASLDEACMAYELPNHIRPSLKPNIGSMIQLPKSVKGTGCDKALSLFQGSATVWAETKYDGERAQIHVQVLDDGVPQITIFSKSKNNSTMDRLGVHGIIREALGFGNTAVNQVRSLVKRNVILDAEMVAWHRDRIDEFWRIDGLVNQTGAGARARRGAKRTYKAAEDEDEDDGRHLALVFFDVLALDDDPLIFQAYSTRRQLLEKLIQPIYSKAMFSERHKIDMTGPDPVTELQHVFADQVASHQEGVVLKAEESEYNEFRLPWVKLKQDYIPGLGDGVDLVIVAAGWDRDRARELRVTPNVYTTFWVGAITNTRDIRTNPNTKPHILVYFTVAYGLDRKALEDLNFRIRNSENIAFPAAEEAYHDLPFAFTISPHLKAAPQVIIRIPFLAELLAAGFTKARESNNYEPRFPRIRKVHARQERPWTDSLDMDTLDKLARNCIGLDRQSKDIDDWCKVLFGKPTSPTIQSRRQERARNIREHLADLEGTSRGSRGPSKRRKLAHIPQKASLTTKIEQQSDSNTRVNPHRSDGNQEFAIHRARSASEVDINNHPVQTDITVSCFMKSDGGNKCENCSRWKSVIAKERRVHSLESLLIACGAANGLMALKQAFVFVHSQDKAIATSVAKKVQEKSKNFGSRIFVFACNSDNLVAENALFVF